MYVYPRKQMTAYSQKAPDTLMKEFIKGNNTTSKVLAIHNTVVANAMAGPLARFGKISDKTTQVIGANDMA